MGFDWITACGKMGLMVAPASPRVRHQRHGAGWYSLETEIVLPVAPAEVFPFFCDVHNLERITPPELRFRVLTPGRLEIREGTLIDYRLAFALIPQDPARPEYRQGQALGPKHRHWFRARFYQQYRLFFRYQAKARVIVYAWVNDADTRRAYGSATDAYRVFRRMIESGNPPDSWDELLKTAREITPS